MKITQPSSSRHKKSRAKRVRLRTQSLRVERLECRRLLSVAPGRINLDNGNVRLDALVDSSRGQNGSSANRNGDFDQNRSQRDSNQFNRNRERIQQRSDLAQTDSGKNKGRRDNRDANNRSSFDRGSMSPVEIRTALELKSESAIPTQIGTTSIASVDVPVSPIISAGSLSETNAGLFAPPNRFAADLRSPLTSQLPRPAFETLSSTLPSSEPPIDSTPLNATFEPQVRRTTAPTPVFVTRPTSLVAPRVAPPTATAESLPTATVNIPSAVASSVSTVAFTATTPNLPFADVFAVAAYSLALFEYGEQIQRSALDVHDSATLLFGGDLDFERLPKLVDSLPAVIHETSPLLQPDGLSNEDLTMEHEPTDLQSLEREVHSDEAREARPTPEKTPHQTSAETRETPADFVFANIGDDEAFGGIVEMPETTTNSDSAESSVRFDSIVPAALRIDQIFSQAPLIEIDDQAVHTLPDQSQEPFAEEILLEQPLTNGQPQPIFIDLRASIPALLLCVPALKVQAMKRDRNHGRIADKNAVSKRYPV